MRPLRARLKVRVSLRGALSGGGNGGNDVCLFVCAQDSRASDGRDETCVPFGDLGWSLGGIYWGFGGNGWVILWGC